MNELRLTRRAENDFADVSPALRRAVFETLYSLALDPQNAGKPLVDTEQRPFGSQTYEVVLRSMR